MSFLFGILQMAEANQRSILANIVGAMLSSSTTKISMAKEFCEFFKMDINFVATAAADYYLHDLLMTVISLSKEDEKRQPILELVESGCFNVQPKLLLHVLARAIQEGEKSEHVLIHYAYRHQQQRTLPKFFSYLLKASKKLSSSEAKLTPAVSNSLADFVLKIPIIQCQSAWTLANQTLQDQAKHFTEDPTGMLLNINKVVFQVG